MKKTIFPDSIEELIQSVCQYAATAKPKSVAVQAGHFLLYYDHTEDQLLPCIRQELTGPRFDHVGETAGEFPLLTWQLGLELMDMLEAEQKSMLSVVNDWQYLPAEADRTDFYKNHPDLFASYQKLLDEHKKIYLLTSKLLDKKTRTGVWFSEVSLRNQFNRIIAKKLKNGELKGEKYIIQKDNGNHLTCSLVDAIGQEQQIYCAGKRGNCTHELAEMNRQVLDLGKFDLFINFYPLVCKSYVQTGTDWAYELFLDNQYTINIGMPSTSVYSKKDLLQNCEITFHGG